LKAFARLFGVSIFCKLIYAPAYLRYASLALDVTKDEKAGGNGATMKWKTWEGPGVLSKKETIYV